MPGHEPAGTLPTLTARDPLREPVDLEPTIVLDVLSESDRPLVDTGHEHQTLPDELLGMYFNG